MSIALNVRLRLGNYYEASRELPAQKCGEESSNTKELIYIYIYIIYIYIYMYIYIYPKC